MARFYPGCNKQDTVWQIMSSLLMLGPVATDYVHQFIGQYVAVMRCQLFPTNGSLEGNGFAQDGKRSMPTPIDDLIGCIPNPKFRGQRRI